MIYGYTPWVSYLRPDIYQEFPTPVLRDVVIGEIRRMKELVTELELNTAFDIVKLH